MGNPKVLVTGAGGFIGSHLSEKLVESGARVTALVHYRGDGGWGWLDTSPLRDEMEIVAGDVRDPSQMDTLVAGQDVVFHLAALIGIPYSYQAPGEYVDTNIRGGLNVLESVRRHDVGRLVMTSTSEVYGTACYVPIDEQHPLQGQSPYSATKIASDQLGLSYFRSFETPVVVVRPFNTYGPRQSSRAVIPTIIHQLLTGEETLCLGNLGPTRDLNFVEDTVAGFIALSTPREALGQVVNLATGKEISIGDLARILIERINPAVRLQEEAVRLRPASSEVTRLVGEASLATSVCDWQPAVSLADGLDRTITWCRENPLHRHQACRYQR